MTNNEMNRRNFIKVSGLAAWNLSANKTLGNDSQPIVMTVSGPVPASSIGSTLTHEHVMVDFIGAKDLKPGRYSRTAVFDIAILKLKELKAAGCNTLVECTPAYLGRDVVLLKELARASGLNIITNTGYYGAVNEKYLPSHAHTESAQNIANRWIDEFKHGIEGSGIRPGMIKTSVDKLPFTAAQEKMIKAAALTHLKTGLTIGVHTGNGEAALAQLEILDALKVHPSAWIWIHSQNEKNNDYHLQIAKRGGWISLDGLSEANAVHYLDMLSMLKTKHFLNKVLVSQDSGWYHVGEPGGGNYNSYTYIHKHFIPEMLQQTFNEDDVKMIFNQNSANAFAIKIRKR